jgi:hypothetical protein
MRKLSSERRQRRDLMKDQVISSYLHGRIRVMFTREKLDTPLNHGEADEDGQWVYINPRKSGGTLVEVIKTLLHEAIHCLEPEWTHNRVYALEKDIWEILTKWEQQHLLLWAIDNGVWRDC